LRPYSDAEQGDVDRLRANALVGSGPQVADKLRALSDRLQVEDMVVITWTHDPAARRRSYELLAREFCEVETPA
jgi:alkanesulfonate monooxygenase SsuD/methylene tetrahydromethanopterin reductase-like flavin-dependent oxidoreductase (luciferase family)